MWYSPPVTEEDYDEWIALYVAETNHSKGTEADIIVKDEIMQEEYDRWRYRCPEFNNTQRWVKVPS